MKKSFAGLTAVMIVTSCVLSGCGADAPQPESDEVFDTEALLTKMQLNERDWLLEQYPDAVAPLPSEIQRIRLIDESEWSDTLAECLTGKGFEALNSSSGGISVGPVPTGQDSALAVAAYICSVEYPVQPSEPLSTDEIGLLYDYFVTDLIPCLEGNGYSIPNAPSREVFVEQFGSQGPWLPYNFVFPGGPEEDRQLRAECPEYPAYLGG